MHSRLTRPLGAVLVAVALGVGAIGVLVVTGGDDPAPPTDSDTERASDDAMPTETRARTHAQDPLQFPNRATTGVPGDWRPAVTRAKDLTVTEPNQTIEDIRFTNSANLLLGGMPTT